jgi:adenine deaminase
VGGLRVPAALLEAVGDALDADVVALLAAFEAPAHLWALMAACRVRHRAVSVVAPVLADVVRGRTILGHAPVTSRR